MNEVTITNPTDMTEVSQVPIRTGRGTTVMVNAGVPFVDTVRNIAHNAGYGGYYRVMLNSVEVFSPTQAPPAVLPGMVIDVLPYDKVG